MIPLVSPLVKCAVTLVGESLKMANIPSSSWAAKILLHNLSEIMTVLLVKLQSLLASTASSICIWLEFSLKNSDWQHIRAETVLSVSMWVLSECVQTRSLDHNQTFTPPTCRYHVVSLPKSEIICRGFVFLAVRDPEGSWHFNMACKSLKGAFPIGW